MHALQALLHEAGVYPGAPGSSADAFPVDPVKWEYFKNWFLKALNVLLHVSRASSEQRLTVRACLNCNFSGEGITCGLLYWRDPRDMCQTIICILPAAHDTAVGMCWQALR